MAAHTAFVLLHSLSGRRFERSAVQPLTETSKNKETGRKDLPAMKQAIRSNQFLGLSRQGHFGDPFGSGA